MELESKIGKTIIALRRIKGISQEQLALGANIDRRYMSDIENGKRRISIAMLSKISDYFGLNLHSFLYFTYRTELLNSNTNWIFDAISELGYEDTVILQNPDYLSAIVGITDDGRIVYQYSRMVDHLILVEGMERNEAIEFIDYNTIRAIPYMGDKAPIIVYDLE